MMVVPMKVALSLIHIFQSYYQWLRECRKKPVDSVVAKVRSKAIEVILVVCLVVGAVTPLVEIARGPVKMIETQQIPAPCDKVKTLSEGLDANFVTPNYRDSFFAQTIGK